MLGLEAEVFCVVAYGLLLPKALVKSPDAADALAIAICHAQHRGAAARLANLKVTA